MAEVRAVAPVANIVTGPTTSGFVSNGRKIEFGVDYWRDSLRFETGPCDAPQSYLNKQSQEIFRGPGCIKRC